MAKRATEEQVKADMSPPNFRVAVQNIRTIPAKKDRIGGINGEIAAIYARVEGVKVNKKAAKIFYMLDRMELVERNDVLRSLDGLLEAADYGSEGRADMLDQAGVTPTGSKVIPMRVSGGMAGAPEEDDGGIEDDSDDIDGVLTGEDVVGVIGELIEDALAGTGEATQIEGDNGGAEPRKSGDADGFTEATEEELAAQAGRVKKPTGGGRKGTVTKIADFPR